MTVAETNEQLEDHADELFGRVEALEGYLTRIADTLQEDGYPTDADVVNVIEGILIEQDG